MDSRKHQREFLQWTSRSGVLKALCSLLWGFAEATFFFIVPDVLLTRYALSDYRQALRCCLWATAGALLGGLLLFSLALTMGPSIEDYLLHIPAINEAMLLEVHSELRLRGSVALLRGGFSGTPYKLYVAQWAALDLSLGVLLLYSLAARLIRFFCSVTLTAILVHCLKRFRQCPNVNAVHLGCWVIFYCWYFTAVG